ncbi:hypothetical protein [Haloferula sp. BvORR071]|uniref:hypothetical protein n=1 Tax=Haloferula sp. BvORR071 TaxID=1396141 RepID=UPI0005564208|nr:hypothetical protein [Haloferula sp. BvORR071]
MGGEITATGLALSAQRALLGNVPSSLRAVSVEAGKGILRFRAIFNSDPDQGTRDFLSTAAAEMIADLQAPCSLDEHYPVVPAPLPMEHLAQLVYLRAEE